MTEQEWHEPFLMRFDGGPYAGTRYSHAGIVEWPLPDVFYLEASHGTYKKVRESELPPQTKESHIVRGAEYLWEPNV